MSPGNAPELSKSAALWYRRDPHAPILPGGESMASIWRAAIAVIHRALT